MTDRQYWIQGGNTYDIREDLKAWCCVWDPGRRAWKTVFLKEDEVAYKRIKSICDANDCVMTKVKLSKEAQDIQRILNKGGV